ncbi:hypothetical protein [Streptomyces sp. NBC_01497]|uniref:hypothetical protein n=1 Tax=Streptomyces sp. NBC_01497 TaxID=2903885 RepID=UPI002E306396|nr:hypothetical protein [Streptomyces sp. NBC_01497]
MSGGPGVPPRSVVVDEGVGRVGELMGAVGPYVQIRPLGGGREWDAEPGAVRVATPTERLRAWLVVVNARSSRPWPPGV